MNIKGNFTVSQWEEHPQIETPLKMTSAKVQYQFSNGLSGKTDIVYAMTYLTDTRAVFQGVHTVTGTVEGKSGTFVMLEKGEFNAPKTQGTWTIVENSGTGELSSIAGEGSFSAEHGGAMTFELRLSNI